MGVSRLSLTHTLEQGDVGDIESYLEGDKGTLIKEAALFSSSFD